MTRRERIATGSGAALAMTEEGTIPSEPNGVTMIARVGNASTLGAMGAPPVAEASDLSEWPRSADDAAA